MDTERAEVCAGGDPGAAAEAVRALHAVARRFLKRRAVSGAVVAARKLKRRKAFAWCCTLDNALQVSAGVSL